MLSLSALRTPITSTQVTATMLSWLQSLGFETTGWAAGKIQLTLIKLFAILVSDVSEGTASTANLAVNKHASGVGLTELSRSHFDNTRVAAVPTAGPARLTSTARVPYTIEVGQLIASTANGIQFRNTTGGTLAAGGTLQLQWQALLAGITGNVPLNAINTLLTPLAGVSIANDEGTPWYTTIGADEEPDSVLQTRNSTKWASLTVELVRESYIQIALAAGARKVEVNDQNPRGAGTIDVIVAGEDGLLGTTDMEAIQAAFYARAFQTDEDWPATPTSRVAALHADDAFLNVSATVYHRASVPGSVMIERCEEALEDLIRRLPIGGRKYTTSLSNVVTLNEVHGLLEDVEDMLTVQLTIPSANLAVGALALVQRGVWSITPVAVAA